MIIKKIIKKLNKEIKKTFTASVTLHNQIDSAERMSSLNSRESLTPPNNLITIYGHQQSLYLPVGALPLSLLSLSSHPRKAVHRPRLHFAGN